jgi:hypothetical protein
MLNGIPNIAIVDGAVNLQLALTLAMTDAINLNHYLAFLQSHRKYRMHPSISEDLRLLLVILFLLARVDDYAVLQT